MIAIRLTSTHCPALQEIALIYRSISTLSKSNKDKSGKDGRERRNNTGCAARGPRGARRRRWARGGRAAARDPAASRLHVRASAGTASRRSARASARASVRARVGRGRLIPNKADTVRARARAVERPREAVHDVLDERFIAPCCSRQQAGSKEGERPRTLHSLELLCPREV
jgi:hypothetical protein